MLCSAEILSVSSAPQHLSSELRLQISNKQGSGNGCQDANRMQTPAQHLTPDVCCQCCPCAVMECGQEKLYAPEQISGMVLEEMRAVADREFGGSVTDAVITVPAYFTDDQRQVRSVRWPNIAP